MNRRGGFRLCGCLKSLGDGVCFCELEEPSASVGEEEDGHDQDDQKKDSEKDDDGEESGASALRRLRLGWWEGISHALSIRRTACGRRAK